MYEGYRIHTEKALISNNCELLYVLTKRECFTNSGALPIDPGAIRPDSHRHLQGEGGAPRGRSALSSPTVQPAFKVHLHHLQSSSPSSSSPLSVRALCHVLLACFNHRQDGNRSSSQMMWSIANSAKEMLIYFFCGGGFFCFFKGGGIFGQLPILQILQETNITWWR